MEAVGAGDVEAARDCLHPDATVWHNYDGKTQTVDENMATLAFMKARCRERNYRIKRLEPIEGGYLQQHTLEVVLNDGTRVATEAVALVAVRDARIERIEEYLDVAPLAALANR